MGIARTPAPPLSSWLLARKLYGRTPIEIATALATNFLFRLLAAACAFGSLVLIAWIAALARAVFRQGWNDSQTLGAAALANASTQASRVEWNLIPVLAVWAALLLLTPSGYTIAFRGTTAAAGVLGALDFSPPSFVVTRDAAGFARDLARFTHSWNAIWLLSATMAAAYLLYHGALHVFNRLEAFSTRRTVRPAHAVCFPLALIVLLSATWSGTVIWLAASPHDATSFGLRGGLVVSDYLLALVVVAVLVASSDSPQGWLLAVAPLAALLGAIANVSPVPRDLVFSVEPAGLERIGSAIGGGSLWAALFIGFPVCLLGVYLMAPSRR